MIRGILLRLFPLLLVLWLEPVHAAAGPQCGGDLDGDGLVTVDELVTAVGNLLNGCDVLPGPRFVDNGDGTVTDNQTGLMWEQKVPGEGCLHCTKDRMDWFTAMGNWISAVNGFVDDTFGSQSGLAGYTDWRIPGLAELRDILLCPQTSPCLHESFGPLPGTCFYFSSTSRRDEPESRAFAVELFAGVGSSLSKEAEWCARAVRSIKRPDLAEDSNAEAR